MLWQKELNWFLRGSSYIMAGNIHELNEVSFGKLKEIGQEKGAIYVGSTDDVKRRTKEHEREGYSGVVYYSKTKNMMRAEDELLKHPGIHNKDKESGAQEQPGSVYVIKGRKFS